MVILRAMYFTMIRGVTAWLLVALLGLSIGGMLGPSFADETQPVHFDRSIAYEWLRRGDHRRDRKEWPEAAQAYQMALVIYRSLSIETPEWEQDYFNFRINQCERELAMIEHTTGRSPEEWLARGEVLTPAEADRYRELYVAVQEENQRLRAVLARKESEIELLEEEIEHLLEMEEIENERREQRESSAPASPEGTPLPESSSENPPASSLGRPPESPAPARPSRSRDRPLSRR